MSLQLEIKRIFLAHTERVKCLDLHPTEPWLLAALYSGHVCLWNYELQSLIKTFEASELPVRAVQFIVRKQWIICGSDDTKINVFNYNTMEKVKSFEAHPDYIRSISVHPSLPYILTASDDMTLRLWDWSHNWKCIRVFEGHSHFVMTCQFNPKNPSMFVSGSLDRKIKIWSITASQCHFTLEGHERGVNCVNFFSGGDKPFLVSGGDDCDVRIWDYQTKRCITVLKEHTNNICSTIFHPYLPIILSGSEDGTLRIWHNSTFALENIQNYGMDRIWAISYLPGTNKVAIGYDQGAVMISLGHEDPVISLDQTGKICYARMHDIVQSSVKSAQEDESTDDGEALNLVTKELGPCEIFPQQLCYSPNGRLLAVCGDGQFIIYKALSFKQKSFGTALQFVWASESGMYATREKSSLIKIFKNDEEYKQFRPPFASDMIFGGTLLGVRSNQCIDFYDWNGLKAIRRIEVVPKAVYWSQGAGDLVVLACNSSFFVLRFDTELVQKYLDQGIEIDEQGIEGSFNLETEIHEEVKSGCFVGDCFIYNNNTGRLNYYIGEQVVTLAHLDKSLYLLGFIQNMNKVYLSDRNCVLYGYNLLLSVLVYQTAIVRGDFELASQTLSSIPENQHSKLAHFLEKQDKKDLALSITKDSEHKFELAIQLENTEVAHEALLQAESEPKWKQLGDLALKKFDLKLAKKCYYKADDLASVFFIATSTGDKEELVKVAECAKKLGIANIAFTANYLIGQTKDCIQVLMDSGRIPEAAFFARTYFQSDISRVVDSWKTDLRKISARAADSLADPDNYPELFTETKKQQPDSPSSDNPDNPSSDNPDNSTF